MDYLTVYKMLKTAAMPPGYSDADNKAFERFKQEQQALADRRRQKAAAEQRERDRANKAATKAVYKPNPKIKVNTSTPGKAKPFDKSMKGGPGWLQSTPK